MACCGDTPTLEVLAAVSILRENLPELKIRVVNVVDLMRLQPCARASARPERNRLRLAVHQGQADHLRLPRLCLAGARADLSPRPTGICMSAATRRRARSPRRSTCACRTTSIASIWCRTSSNKLPHLGSKGAYLKQKMRDKLIEHKHFIDEHGEDLPEIRNWLWKAAK